MNNIKLRFFGAGMLLVAVVLFIYVQFFDKTDQEEVKNALEKDGFTVVATDEFQGLKDKVKQLEQEKEQLIAEQQKTEDKQSEEQTKEEETKEEEPEQPEKVVVKIESGMSLSDIADRLKEHQIIEDTKAFKDFMIEKEYERYVQIGDFEFTKGMSLEEIADVITR
ncbi:endolytic transglycosylase MltG [Pallidibacillus pasinlerensis]|uniref:Endolytic transglycosylase MltG n=1 Tax=Pallidibacillus pasinlerensis TaxID=2703818 RepID=A0ABX0A6M2_9BACI|nr:endolytic transglycosylase MltG [Pallidibacillus pasinlerensis]NCU17895.1 endolytic transglycosylase MltG [Pallidibacillus pasinlerensis]